MRPDSPGPEAPLEALYRQILDSWNSQDAAGMAAAFAASGSVVGFDGSQLDGPAAIAAEMGRIFADHATGAYVGSVRAVEWLGPDAALLRAVAGVVPHGASDINPALNAIQALVAVKEAGQWRVALYQNTPAQFHGRPELVEALTAELRALLPGHAQRTR